MSEIPKYEVIRQTIISPHRLEPGSVIETFSSPGDHLAPLNQAARDAMEVWYNEEHPVLDRDGEPIFYLDERGQRTQKMWKPHASSRPVPYEKVEEANFRLVAPPPKPNVEDVMKSLAAINVKRPTRDVRPPPEYVARTDLGPPEPEIDFAEQTLIVASSEKLTPAEATRRLKESRT